jgi:hypothetical protein
MKTVTTLTVAAVALHTALFFTLTGCKDNSAVTTPDADVILVDIDTDAMSLADAGTVAVVDAALPDTK